MTLRYKAVSQYASEDELFTFITQHVSEHKIQGEFFGRELMDSIMYQFQLTDKEARDAIQRWLTKRVNLLFKCQKMVISQKVFIQGLIFNSMHNIHYIIFNCIM